MIREGRLETPRLYVRPFEPDDAPALVALFADPQVAAFVGDGGPLSHETAEVWIARSRRNVARHGYGTGAVIERASDELIGWAGFARPENAPEEIIYGLRGDRWRQGYGSEIVSALVAFAEAELPPAPLRATVDAANLASARILRSQGFERVSRDHAGEPGVDLYVRPLPAAQHCP